MRLYHGSNQDIESIDLAKGMRHKDFGKGFYLTPNRATALRMAQKKARLFGGVPTLISYELDESVLHSDLKVKVFPARNGSGSWMPTATGTTGGPSTTATSSSGR